MDSLHQPPLHGPDPSANIALLTFVQNLDANQFLPTITLNTGSTMRGRQCRNTAPCQSCIALCMCNNKKAATYTFGLGELLYPSRHRDGVLFTSTLCHIAGKFAASHFSFHTSRSRSGPRPCPLLFYKHLDKSMLYPKMRHSELRRLPFTAIGDCLDSRHLRHASVLISIC